MENKKQAIVLSGVAIVALLALIIGATFAYFQATGNGGSTTNINVTTYTTDLLTFEMGGDIKINADQTSFAEGKGNATGSTFAKAILTANNKTNTATKNYYVYLNISENTFTYTQNENTPELLLTITDASGNTVTSISGLTYKTVTDGKGATIKGFDITSKTDLITLFDNREITANPTKTEQWNITVTFVNYNANQAGNSGKSFSAKLMIQKDKTRYDMVCDESKLACHVAKLYTETQGEKSLYYHDSSLANGAGDNSYRYAGASDSLNNYICLGSDEATCPDANLFRIIGVFGAQTKVIRAKSVGNQHWSTNASNTWSSSSLNTYLNGTYLTSLGTLAEKIATTTWKVGGGAYANISQSVPKTAYQYEVGSSASTTTVDKKIGLMYISDYGFAADQSGWTTKLSSYDSNTSKNWLYLFSYEWTISRYSDNTSYAFYVTSPGSVDYTLVTNSSAARPSFSLESSITYVSGSGSASDPIVIN